MDIISLILKRSRTGIEDNFYRCWICEAAIRDETEFLYHIHECNAVKNSGLPLKYDINKGTWRFDRAILLSKNKTNAPESLNTRRVL